MAVDMKKHIVGNEPHPDYKLQESPIPSAWIGNKSRPSAKTQENSYDNYYEDLDPLRIKMKLISGRVSDTDIKRYKKILEGNDVPVGANEIILQEYNRIYKETERNNRIAEQLRRAIEMQNQDYPSIEQRQLDDKPNITIPSGY